MSTTQDALSPSGVAPSHRGRWIIGALVAVLIIFVIWSYPRAKKTRARRTSASRQSREGGARRHAGDAVRARYGCARRHGDRASAAERLSHRGGLQGRSGCQERSISGADRSAAIRDRFAAGAGRASEGSGIARSGALGPRPLSPAAGAEGDRRADGDRSGIHRRNRTRPRSNPTRPTSRNSSSTSSTATSPRRSAGRVGLRLVDPGNYVTASSSPGIVVITTMKPTTVRVHRRPERSRQGDRALQFRREAAGHRLYERQQPGDRDRHALCAQQSDGHEHRHRDSAREVRQRR